MPSRTFPLVAWGSADDLSASPYSTVGTLAAITTTTDPFGGSAAYTLNDTDGAAFSRRTKATGLGTLASGALVFAVKAGTASVSAVRIEDTTSGTVLQVNQTWSGGVPTFSVSPGTLVGSIALGGGWYLGIATCGAINGAHTNNLEFFPAGLGSAAATGSTSFYIRNIALLDLLGSPKAFSRPAQGYEAVTAPSGTRDAWKVKAPDEVLQGRASWIPTSPRSFPIIVSGWDGQNESTGINCGVKAMLEAGFDMNVMRVAPDRSACTSYNDSYLTQPTGDWTPELEGNADRAVQLEFVSSSPFTGF